MAKQLVRALRDQRIKNRGALAERRAIVAWLRALAGKELSSVEWLQQARSEFAGIIAKSIESGVHLNAEQVAR